MKILGMSLLAAWIIIACNTASNTQISATTSKPTQPSTDVQEVLSWLPADTETVTVANGSFLLPNVYTEKEETQNRELSDQDLAQNFESLPAALLGLNNGLLVKHLKGKRVSLAIEGARHFRAPAALGGMPFEGCAITIFAGDLGDTGDSFIKGTQKVALRVEEIEGQKVAAFQEKLEQDLWTSFVAFPSRNVVLVATNRNYIRKCLRDYTVKRGPGRCPIVCPSGDMSTPVPRSGDCGTSTEARDPPTLRLRLEAQTLRSRTKRRSGSHSISTRAKEDQLPSLIFRATKTLSPR
jgi:hypothetical protein